MRMLLFGGRTVRPDLESPELRSVPRHHHHVNVVELADQVWNEPRFRSANPGYRLGKAFVYAGIQANRFVFDYGLRLLPTLYEIYDGACQAARETEVELATGLREAGFGVWQAWLPWLHFDCRPGSGAGEARHSEPLTRGGNHPRSGRRGRWCLLVSSSPAPRARAAASTPSCLGVDNLSRVALHARPIHRYRPTSMSRAPSGR